MLHTDSGPVFQLLQAEASESQASGDPPALVEPEPVAVQQTFVFATFDGAQRVEPTGVDQAQTLHNYYVGDQSRWRTGVRSYETVAYPDLYEGIDLFTWGRRNSLKYEFHVDPGADYSQIQVSYQGIDGLCLDQEGALHIQTAFGELVDDAPYVYQEIDGKRVEIGSQFVLVDQDTYSFHLANSYNAEAEIIIDPMLAWSTYLGGESDDCGYGIAVDGSGNLIVTGSTYSPGWTSGGFDTSYNGGSEDAFVAKLSSAGAHLWSTYLGGTSSDSGEGIAVDASGDPIVTGHTYSSGWTSGGFDTSYNGGYGDAFVAKLSSAGAHLWSTYLGGESVEGGYGIAVDSSGNPIVAGFTESSGWTSGGFDTSHNGSSDAFVAKLSSAGAHLWSTYLGGTNDDFAKGIAVDGSGSPIVTGSTCSSGWTSGGFDTSHNGPYDAFVAKLSSAGAHLWSTYLGGESADEGYGIAVDSFDNPIVAGLTNSSGWTSGGFDTSHNGSSDAFVAKLSTEGAHVWSTYLGGTNNDLGEGIAVDSSGNPIVAGFTDSSGWTSGGFDTSYNGSSGIGGDAFVAKLSSAGAHLWSTYLGGTSRDYGEGIAVDSSGNPIVAGFTDSSGWTSGGFDTSHNGDLDAFVVKIFDSGSDNIGVHRDQMWYLDADGSQSWNVPGDDYFSFGISTDEPIVGDWDGDGYDEVGVHRGDMWYLDTGGSRGWNIPGDTYFGFGIDGDEPVVGDWDGDGVDEVGVHRDHMWYLDYDGNHQWNIPGDTYFSFGITGDEPVVGDWDGDGVDEVGVHRPSTGMWYLDYDGNHQWNVPGDAYFRFGIAGDEPVVGDWNSDGVDEVGVHRGNWWYLDTDGSHAWNVPGDDYFRFGIVGDQPVVGRWQAAGGGASQSGGGQASFASASSGLPAEPETGLMVGLLSTSTSAATNATQVDSVFAAEPAALSFAAESDTELPIDAISGQVTRSNRLGSGGLLDLPTSNVHDQALEELLQSIWWLDPNDPSVA